MRQSGLVILMLGEGYGAKQGSGLSAIHEEYREARDRKPVIGFVQEGVTPVADEAAFLKEVQEWSKGLFRGGFRTAEKLRGKIVRAGRTTRPEATRAMIAFLRSTRMGSAFLAAGFEPPEDALSPQ